MEPLQPIPDEEYLSPMEIPVVQSPLGIDNNNDDVAASNDHNGEEQLLFSQEPAAATEGSNFDSAPAMGDFSDRLEKVAPMAKASKVSALDGHTMRSLFGPAFRAEKVREEVAADPALKDTRARLQDLFGAAVQEEDILVTAEEKRILVDTLEREMTTNKQMIVYEEGTCYFGAATHVAIRDELMAPFTLLRGAVPPKPVVEEGEGPAWLLDMPIIYPNRQTLHADPRPCDPAACDFLESNKYMLFTPHNVLRWSVDEKEPEKYKSNTRLVRWSNGSITMHVGADVLLILPAQDTSLNMLCEPVDLQKDGFVLPSMISAEVPKRHFVVRTGEAASVEAALSRERVARSEMKRVLNLPQTDNALPPIDWLKPQAGRSVYEEYVRVAYEEREKEIKRRLREGNPMTAEEQMQMEQELRDHLANTSEEALMQERQEAADAAALKMAQRAELRSRQRSRFDRDLNLHGSRETFGMGADPFLDEGVSDDDDADSYEEGLEAMYQRANGTGDANEQPSKRTRGENGASSSQQQAFASLETAMSSLASRLPMTSEAYASVDGTLSFMRQSGLDAKEMIQREVPKMLAEVAIEMPDEDTTAVQSAFEKLFR